MVKRKVLFFLAICLLILFTYFSYLVAKKTFRQIDFDTTVKVQDHLSRRFDYPFSILSLLGSVEITSLIWLSLFALTLIRKYFLASFGLLLFWGALAGEIFGKFFVFHPSPPQFLFRGVININFPSHYVHTNYSYPSGHLTRTTFLASFLLIYYLRRSRSKLALTVLLIGVILSMSLSRIYLGEHWLSDVMGGLFWGSGLGVLAGSLVPEVKKADKAEVKV